VEDGPALSVRDLRVTFTLPSGEHSAVDGVDLDLQRGETLALVGESGCGKSVLALALLGLVDPPGRMAAGSILLGDVELVGCDERTLRDVRGNRMAMVFQEPATALNPVTRIGLQVAEPLQVHRGLGRTEARAAALEALAEVGVPAPKERFDSYPHELSGGLRQRVLIAMALICEPQVLIADEPTTALDVTMQRQILDLLRDLQRKRRMATLFVTHDLALVESMADRVAVMYAGHIVEQGQADALVQQPRHPYTRALWRANPAAARHGRPLAVIPGSVPDITNRPSGCLFHPRCDRASERCRAERPLLADGVACFMPHDTVDP
jgi:oligopeptide/dipeptide ABC transporter ATP-binding protein